MKYAPEKGGKEFFKKAEKVFFEEYLVAYRDHVESVGETTRKF